MLDALVIVCFFRCAVVSSTRGSTILIRNSEFLGFFPRSLFILLSRRGMRSEQLIWYLLSDVRNTDVMLMLSLSRKWCMHKKDCVGFYFSFYICMTHHCTHTNVGSFWSNSRFSQFRFRPTGLLFFGFFFALSPVSFVLMKNVMCTTVEFCHKIELPTVWGSCAVPCVRCVRGWANDGWRHMLNIFCHVT